jgi:predicted CDP-diglyceride synthetase/phosphatidate cytidylyltransferase
MLESVELLFVVIKFVLLLLVIFEIIVWLLELIYGCLLVIDGFVGDIIVIGIENGPNVKKKKGLVSFHTNILRLKKKN